MMDISTFSLTSQADTDRLLTPFPAKMPSPVTGASLLAVIMTLTACLRLARALPLNSGSGAQQRHAYVGHRTSVSIPRHRVWNMDRRTGVQSLSCAATRGTDSRCGAVTPAERIYQLAGREFEIGKPSVLAKVLFDEVGVFDPQGSGSTSPPINNKAKTAGGHVKSKSVSATALKAVLKGEENPLKRELVQLVLDWRNAEAVPKRGGFVASGAKVADMPAWSSRLIPDHDELAVDPSAAPVLLIDGHYIIFRSFHGMPDLTAPDGTPVGALLGFCNVINRLVLRPWVDGIEPRRKVVVAFDTVGDNFRHELYPGYKASRAEAPEDLRPQFALIRSACEAYGLDIVEGVGFEADDVLASLALEAVTAGATDVTIASADKDLAQLVTRRVSMLNVYTNERLGPDEVLSKFLAPPGRLADFLAITGDKSDDIVGVNGYGPVKAAKVLAKYATLEEAVDEICAELTKKKVDPALVEQTREQASLARRLVELSTAVPLDRRTGAKTLDSVTPFALQSGIGKGTERLLEFMRDNGLPDLAERTSNILGVDTGE